MTLSNEKRQWRGRELGANGLGLWLLLVSTTLPLLLLLLSLRLMSFLLCPILKSNSRLSPSFWSQSQRLENDSPNCHRALYKGPKSAHDFIAIANHTDEDKTNNITQHNKWLHTHSGKMKATLTTNAEISGTKCTRNTNCTTCTNYTVIQPSVSCFRGQRHVVQGALSICLTTLNTPMHTSVKYILVYMHACASIHQCVHACVCTHTSVCTCMRQSISI